MSTDPTIAPETHNSEQDDETAQAQTVAEAARGRQPVDYGSPTESVKVKSGLDDNDSTQDLVDHMRDMESSGRIDMGAFRGEPMMDDEDETYGTSDPLDDDEEDSTAFHDA